MSNAFTIFLTDEQRESISAFFAHSGWELSLAKQRSTTVQCEPQTDEAFEETSPTPARSIPRVEGVPECPHCFCQPCVTAKEQKWLGVGQAPSRHNPGLRRVMYKDFWRLIDRSQGWKDPRYLQKKKNSLRNRDMVFTRREMMPKCVLAKVRGLYPNPPGVPYVGHRWY